MTIGDVLAVTTGLMLIGAAWGATVVLFALAFPGRAAAAQAALALAPKRCLGTGFAAAAGSGLLAALCAGAAAGPIKLLAGIFGAGIVFLAAIGSAGAVRLLGQRIAETGAPMTPFACLTRASMLYVLAGFLPVFGWFIVLPAALCFAAGSAVLSAFPARAPIQARQAEAEAV